MRDPSPDIARVLSALWSVHRQATDGIERARAYARVILDAYFLGDVEVWRAWGGRSPELPKLARERLPVSYDRLKRMVRVADAWARLPPSNGPG